jgi:hypothetical protein
MLHLSPACNYYLYRGNTDMRKGFDKWLGFISNATQCTERFSIYFPQQKAQPGKAVIMGR